MENLLGLQFSNFKVLSARPTLATTAMLYVRQTPDHQDWPSIYGEELTGVSHAQEGTMDKDTDRSRFGVAEYLAYEPEYILGLHFSRLGSHQQSLRWTYWSI